MSPKTTHQTVKTVGGIVTEIESREGSKLGRRRDRIEDGCIDVTQRLDIKNDITDRTQYDDKRPDQVETTRVHPTVLSREEEKPMSSDPDYGDVDYDDDDVRYTDVDETLKEYLEGNEYDPYREEEIPRVGLRCKKCNEYLIDGSRRLLLHVLTCDTREFELTTRYRYKKLQ